MNDNETDVVVVGARCAGAATAMLLARCGYRVTVVERGPAGAATFSAYVGGLTLLAEVSPSLAARVRTGHMASRERGAIGTVEFLLHALAACLTSGLANIAAAGASR